MIIKHKSFLLLTIIVLTTGLTVFSQNTNTVYVSIIPKYHWIDTFEINHEKTICQVKPYIRGIDNDEYIRGARIFSKSNTTRLAYQHNVSSGYSLNNLTLGDTIVIMHEDFVTTYLIIDSMKYKAPEVIYLKQKTPDAFLYLNKSNNKLQALHYRSNKNLICVDLTNKGIYERESVKNLIDSLGFSIKDSSCIYDYEISDCAALSYTLEYPDNSCYTHCDQLKYIRSRKDLFTVAGFNVGFDGEYPLIQSNTIAVQFIDNDTTQLKELTTKYNLVVRGKFNNTTYYLSTDDSMGEGCHLIFNKMIEEFTFKSFSYTPYRAMPSIR